VRRALISCAVVAVALIAQLTIVNRLALPGGAGPDLVLLAVVALALTSGPVPGMLTGFFAGLALDIAPPASHTIGQYALVFCLIGYACGRLAALGEASPALYVAISAAAAAVGAALHAALGIMLSDPQVTWSAVRHVLPPSLAYDVILSPFVLYAVVRLGAWAGRAAPGQEGTQAAGAVGAGWLASALNSSGPTAVTVRQASVSGTPNLHLGGRRSGDAWVGAARTAGAARLGTGQRQGGKREPKLRFGGARGGSGVSPAAAARLGGGAAAGRLTGSKPVPRMRFGAGRRHDGLVGGGSGALPRSARGAAVPRFRKRRIMGAAGTGGSLSRGRTGGSAFGGRSAPRLRMRRGRMRSKIRRLMGKRTGGYR
jgi:rod shape-determining protein MreD